MATQRLKYDITKDDLSAFKELAFVTFGEAMVRDVAREQRMNTDHIVWAHRAEPFGRFLYEIGRTP